MSINKEDIKAYEARHKELLYNKIGELTSRLAEIIIEIQKAGEQTDIDTDIPNIGITFNNKLIQLSQEFAKAGISMFAEPKKEYGFVGQNFVGDAIIEDLIFQLSDAIQLLEDYGSSFWKVVTKETEVVQDLEKSGPIKKIFLKIRSFFVPTTVSDLTSFKSEEIEELNSDLAKYKEADENLWQYNLRNNVVQSLVKLITDRQYHDFTISGIIEKSVIPTLQKLGLEDVIPQLQEELTNSQKKLNISNNKSWELSVTQRRKVQISSERVAGESKVGNKTNNNQDLLNNR